VRNYLFIMRVRVGCVIIYLFIMQVVVGCIIN